MAISPQDKAMYEQRQLNTLSEAAKIEGAPIEVYSYERCGLEPTPVDARLAEGVRPVAIPEGWRMRIEEGAAVVQKEGLGGVAVYADDANIAAGILHALVTDILAARDAAPSDAPIVASVRVNLTCRGGVSEVSEPIFEMTSEFEALVDANPGKEFWLCARKEES